MLLIIIDVLMVDANVLVVEIKLSMLVSVLIVEVRVTVLGARVTPIARINPTVVAMLIYHYYFGDVG